MAAQAAAIGIKGWLFRVLLSTGLFGAGTWVGPTWIFEPTDTPPVMELHRAYVQQLYFGPTTGSGASDRFFFYLPFDRPCRIKGKITYQTGPHAKPGTGTEEFDFTANVAKDWLLQTDLDLWPNSISLRGTTLKNLDVLDLTEMGVQSVRIEAMTVDKKQTQVWEWKQ